MTAHGPEPAVTGVARAGTWTGFAAMCVGMFMAILDVQIVATSLPSIQDALAIAPDRMSWVQTAYLIAEVIAIPLTGALTRIFGMRRLFVAGILVFTLASAGCAASGSFEALVAWRILQGFAGGALIPAVFSAVFLLFPADRQALATMLAGVLAVLAPTVGPIVGGWVTQTYSWHWLFLINVLPGVACAALGARLLPAAPFRPDEARKFDTAALLMMAACLAALEIALKEAPGRGWLDGLVVGLFVLAVSNAVGFVARTRRAPDPVVDLGNFADRNFAVGCVLSFALGIGLFGSVYLMPVFLAFVRGHDALEIGTIMLVTGVAQLAAAPLAVLLERRIDARLLTAAGFALFAFGLGLSAGQTPQSDYDAMFWPQAIRGFAIMFCLLPPTRLALGHLAPTRIPDASGLFNLMRNLGGAIGLALIDTVIYSRVDGHAADLAQRLMRADPEAASFVGLTADGGAGAQAAALVGKAALTLAINDAWAMVAALTVVALLCVPLARRAPVS